MNLQAKFTFWMGGLLAAAVLGAGGWVLWQERVSLWHGGDAARRSALAAFARSGSDAAVIHDDLAAVNAAIEAARSPGARAAYVADESGRMRVHSDPARIGQMEPPLDDDQYRLVQPLGPSGRRAVMVYSRRALTDDVRRALAPGFRRVVGASTAALFLGWVGAWILAGHVTRPLRTISEGTRRLAEGSLDHRLDFRRGDELGRLAGDFDRMAARLGELDAMKRDFVSNVTHELRSPLSAIESYANLIADGARQGQTGDLLDHVTIVRNNATRLGHFINDLLDLAKIDARRMELNPRVLRTETVLQEAVDLFAALAAEKGVSLTRDPASVGRLWADPDKLLQILTNLVGNALKFTPRGGRVSLSATEVGKETRIDVADTGPGVGAEEQKRLFERFVQGEGGRSGKGPKGTGLGLSIVRGLAEAHGGRVCLSSTPGQGSVFSVILPGVP